MVVGWAFLQSRNGALLLLSLAKEKLTHAGLDSEENFCSEMLKRLVPFRSIPLRCGAVRYGTVTCLVLYPTIK